jgi:apolipoprotein N-acyltransferase
VRSLNSDSLSRAAFDASAVLLASVLYIISLPPFDLWPAALFVTAPLCAALLDPHRRYSTRRTLAIGLTFGELTTLAVGGPWLFYGANGFFGKSFAFSAVFTFVTTVTHAGVFIGLGVAFMSSLRNLRPPVRAVGAASMWVAWEYVRSTLLYGCPWNLLGHAFHETPVLMQTAGLGGVPAISWVAAAVGAGIGTAFVERRQVRSALACLAISATALAISFLYGTARLDGRDPAGASGPTIAGLVQANVGGRELWNPAGQASRLSELLNLSRDAAVPETDLLVWAENAVPFALNDNVDARDRIQKLSDETKAAVLVGAPRAQNTVNGQAEFFNSLYFFTPGSDVIDAYDKSTLLPYIEATPSWAAGIARTNGIEYTAGSGVRVLPAAGRRIAPLICFESTYPGLSRRARRLGADLIVNVSNDSWFETTAAPDQHLAMTRFRAVETGLPIIRVANTGISSVIDPWGVELGRLEKSRVAVGRFHIPDALAEPPLFVTVGDAFAILVSALAFLLWCAGWSSKRGCAGRP